MNRTGQAAVTLVYAGHTSRIDDILETFVSLARKVEGYDMRNCNYRIIWTIVMGIVVS